MEEKTRLIELDLLRGASILGMILVITPGSWSQRFQWMNHAEWQGYPLSDMIFPGFLFCVGMSMAISFHKNTAQDKDSVRFSPFLKVLKRTALLIVIGLLVNGFPFFDFQNLRLPGILQRIALCYLIAASIWIILTSGKVKNPALWLAICAGVILIVYYILLYYIPVPGTGIAGDNSSGSWPVIIDQRIFGIKHLWEYGISNGKVTYDPEGILASFPASVNVILGLIIGIFYTQDKNQYNTTLLLGLGISLLLLGLGLDYFHIMPSIKKIWTGSFALISGGFSLIVLACIRLLLMYVPAANRFLYPLIVYGANAILAFVVSNMLLPVFDLSIINGKSIRDTGYNFFNLFVPSNQWSSLSFSLTFLILLFIPLWFLYKRKIFLKV